MADVALGVGAGASVLRASGQIVKAGRYVINKATDMAEAVGFVQTQLQQSKGKFDLNFNIDKLYVNRPPLEKIVRDFLVRRIQYQNYAIVAGPKGVGKTTLLHAVTKNMSGVVRIKVTDTDTGESILNKLLFACHIDNESSFRAEELIMEALDAECRSDDMNGTNNPIKIVIEVERGGNSENILRVISSVAKTLATRANVLVIVSEANATLGFTSDSGRQMVIWVDDMTEEEAKLYLSKQGVHLDAAALATVQQQIGFQPISLERLVDAVAQNNGLLGDFITQRVAVAKSELKKFTLFPILRALKASPEGVSTDVFVGQRYEGINLANPVEVFRAMKETNVVMYHSPSDQYRLVSKAHATALANFNIPNVN